MRHDGRAYMRAQRILRRLTHADYRLARTPQSHFLATHGTLARRIAHTSPRIQRFKRTSPFWSARTKRTRVLGCGGCVEHIELCESSPAGGKAALAFSGGINAPLAPKGIVGSSATLVQ